MRPLSAPLAARLVDDAMTLVQVWRIERRDGATFGFTDHDASLTFLGLVCSPSLGLAGGAIEKAADLSIDSASISGVLDDEAITADDLARGVWDGARADVYKVDWRDPALFVHLYAGRFGEARRGAASFEIELRGLTAPLNRPVGRVFSRYCDADLGDVRCGKDVSGSAFTGAGAITEVVSARVFRTSGLSGFDDGWFTLGRVLWSGGGANDVAVHRAGAASALIELFDIADAIAPGAAFTIVAGCDKRLGACRAKFANSANFRGFPHMPGNDVIQAGPPASGNDGSSRQ